MRRTVVVRYCLLGMLALLIPPSVAVRAAAPLELGGVAPPWKALPSADGTTHSSDQLEDAKAVVVVFTCNACPVAQAYEKRLKQFVQEYHKQGVELVAIHVSKHESLEDAKAHAKQREFSFPYLHDAEGATAKAFGAKATPHVFLLDGQKQLVYRGAFDDQMIESKVEKHYLIDAVDAVLNAKEVEKKETRPIGCVIHY